MPKKAARSKSTKKTRKVSKKRVTKSKRKKTTKISKPNKTLLQKYKSVRGDFYNTHPRVELLLVVFIALILFFVAIFYQTHLSQQVY